MNDIELDFTENIDLVEAVTADLEPKRGRRKLYSSKSEGLKYRKARFRAEKKCVKCGKQDERTLSGKSICEKCHKYNLDRLKMKWDCSQCGKRFHVSPTIGVSFCPFCGAGIKGAEDDG